MVPAQTRDSQFYSEWLKFGAAVSIRTATLFAAPVLSMKTMRFQFWAGAPIGSRTSFSALPIVGTFVGARRNNILLRYGIISGKIAYVTAAGPTNKIRRLLSLWLTRPDHRTRNARSSSIHCHASAAARLTLHFLPD
jgi:hypothetical protein